MRKKQMQTKKKQGGFTLVELLVTVALLSIVLAMTVQVTDAFFHRYRMIEARWKAQNAAQRVMQYFEMRSESLSNSASISLFYTDMEGNPQPIDASVDAQTSTVMEGVPKISNKTYAYIYSAPDPNQPERGDLIYVLERSGVQENADGTATELQKRPQSLTQYLLHEDVPLNIRFNVSTVPQGVEKQNENGTPTYVYGGGEDDYLRTTVDVVISTPRSVGGNYTLKSSFTMNNMAKNQIVNFEGGDVTPVKDQNKLDVAGWTNKKLNEQGKCPADKSTHPFAEEPANILRYISTVSLLESQNINGEGVDLAGAGLCFGKLSMYGSKFEAQTVGALHDFRDHVLAKTALGNQVIDKYYNEWSPALLAAAKEHPGLLKVGKCILVPFSWFAMLTAD